MFPDNNILTVRGRLVSLARPRVMGILNITPDSFYEGSRVMDAAEISVRVAEMIADGADIIDVGACSTRPGSFPVGAEEELSRLIEPLKMIRETFPETLLSVDTFRASVAEECLNHGLADIINDVSGGREEGMLDTVARHGAVYVLMHTRGTPDNMDSLCDYSDVTAEVIKELAFKLNDVRKAGIYNVIVDPGFGFAKTNRQNYALLENLDYFKELGCPVLVGVSRKRMVRGSASQESEDALTGTIALNTVALMKGASIIRVHDVKEAVVTRDLVTKLWNLE